MPFHSHSRILTVWGCEERGERAQAPSIRLNGVKIYYVMICRVLTTSLYIKCNVHSDSFKHRLLISPGRRSSIYFLFFFLLHSCSAFPFSPSAVLPLSHFSRSRSVQFYVIEFTGSLTSVALRLLCLRMCASTALTETKARPSTTREKVNISK